VTPAILFRSLSVFSLMSGIFIIFLISACSRSTISFEVFAGATKMCQDTAS
jgi:hypothetical protein